MPPTFVQHIPINSEWAEALVGLRLNVPNSWWPGFVDDGLNRGRIAAINLDTPNAFYFEVELNNKLGAHYAMRYDSVLLYADEGQPGFSRFRLPMLCPGNPDDEIVRVRVLIGKNGGTMVDGDFTKRAAMTVQLKDMRNAMATAQAMGFDAPITQLFEALYAQAVQDGLSDLDHSGLFVALAQRNGMA